MACHRAFLHVQFWIHPGRSELHKDDWCHFWIERLCKKFINRKVIKFLFTVQQTCESKKKQLVAELFLSSCELSKVWLNFLAMNWMTWRTFYFWIAFLFPYFLAVNLKIFSIQGKRSKNPWELYHWSGISINITKDQIWGKAMSVVYSFLVFRPTLIDLTLILPVILKIKRILHDMPSW